MTKQDAVLDVHESARKLVLTRETVPLEQKRKKLRPRNEWVVIRKVDPKDRISSGGVVITEGQAKSSLGEVVSFSAKVTDLERGDLVIFTNFAQALAELEDATGEKNLFLVREEEVYAVLVDEN